MEQQNKKIFLINLIYYSVIGVTVYLVLRFALSYFLPIVVAGVVAHLVQQPANLINKRLKISKSFCSVFIVVALYFASVGLIILTFFLLFSFVRSMFGDFAAMGNMLMKYFEKIRGIYSDFIYRISPETANMLENMMGNFITRVSNFLVNAVSNFATGVAKSIPSFFLSFIVSLVAGCYIAKDYRGWIGFIKGLVNRNFWDKAMRFKTVAGKCISCLLKGYIKLWFITFLELLIGFFLLGIKYAPIVALAVSLVDLLPVLGTGTVLIPWGIAELIVNKPFFGFGLLLLYIVITFLRNFLEPKIIGSQIGINPLFTLIAMFAGLRLFGFWGLIIFPMILISIIKYYKEETEEMGLS